MTRPNTPDALVDRLADRLIITDSGCWETGYRTNFGYVRIKIYGKRRHLHTVAYDILVGDRNPALMPDHLCRNRACFNPDHLEPVTCRENLLRGEGFAAKNAQKTACLRGHEFTPENTIWENGGRSRHCRTCKNAWARANRAQKRRAA